MTAEPAIAALSSLEPDEILSAAPDVLWVDADRCALMLRVPVELACAADGHLGYTQLVRLCEIARHALWRGLVQPSAAVVDCIVVRFELTCQRKITSGQLVSIRPSLVAVGTTSFTLAVSFTNQDGADELAGCALTLVALDGTGRPVPVRAG